MTKWSKLYPEATITENSDGSVHIVFPEGYAHPFTAYLRPALATVGLGEGGSSHTHPLTHEVLDAKAYDIHWQITGTVRVVAASKEEAEEKFGALHVSRLAEEGELEADEPRELAVETV